MRKGIFEAGVWVKSGSFCFDPARSTKNDCMDVLQRLQREVDDGNVNVLVVATSGHLARHWNAAESINLNQVLSEPKVRLLLSPVLKKPPVRLLECLDRSFRKELPDCIFLCRVFSLKYQSNEMTFS